jgi:hypothetical protein
MKHTQAGAFGSCPYLPRPFSRKRPRTDAVSKSAETLRSPNGDSGTCGKCRKNP